MFALWIFLGALTVFIAIILIRTLSFKPIKQKEPDNDVIEFDSEKAIASLQQLIKCKTVSYYDKTL